MATENSEGETGRKEANSRHKDRGDPSSSKVLVKDERNFTAPTEGTLLGCEHFTSRPHKRLFQEGQLEIGWWINYEVRGKKFDRDNILNTIKDIDIFLPSGKRFDLWKDL
jgi:hypothetical protein